MKLNDNKQEKENNIFVMKNYGNCNATDAFAIFSFPTPSTA